MSLLIVVEDAMALRNALESAVARGGEVEAAELEAITAVLCQLEDR